MALRLCGSTPTVGSSSRRIWGSCSRRRGQVQPPLHAAAEVPDRVLGAIGQSGDLQRASHGAAQRAAAHAVESAEERQVFVRGKLVVERQVLRHQAHAALDRVRSPRTSAPSIRTSPRSGGQQAGDHGNGGGLAGAVRPEQSHHLAGVRGERDLD